MRVDLPAPFGPVMAIRGAQLTWRLTGPRRKPPRRMTASRIAAAPGPGRGAGGETAAFDGRVAQGGGHRAGPGRGGDLHFELPLLARLGDDVQAVQHPLRGLDLARQLFRTGDLPVQDVLVVVGRLGPGLTDTLVGPADLGPHPFLEPSTGVGVLLVGLAGVLPGDLPLPQVGEITAAVEAYLMLRQVEFQD